MINNNKLYVLVLLDKEAHELGVYDRVYTVKETAEAMRDKLTSINILVEISETTIVTTDVTASQVIEDNKVSVGYLG